MDILNSADSTSPASPDRQLERNAAPSRSARRWYRDPLLFIALTAALGLDQLTKWLITSNMAWGQSIPEEGFLRLTFVHNTGSAFGLFQGQGMILSVIAFVAVGAMIWLYRSSPMPSLLMRAALGLQMGGAIGNLIDRLRLGYVVDFFDVGLKLTGTLLTSGIVILAWYFGTGRDLPNRGGVDGTPADEAPPGPNPA